MGRTAFWQFVSVYGDLASLAGFLLSLVGFALTISSAQAAQKAAEKARQAVNQVRARLVANELSGSIQTIHRYSRDSRKAISWHHTIMYKGRAGLGPSRNDRELNSEENLLYVFRAVAT